MDWWQPLVFTLATLATQEQARQQQPQFVPLSPERKTALEKLYKAKIPDTAL